MENNKEKVLIKLLYSGFDKKRSNTGAISKIHCKSNFVYLYGMNNDKIKIAKFFKLFFGSLDKGRFTGIPKSLVTDGPFPTYNPFLLFRLRIVMISHGHLIKKQGVDGYYGWKKFFKYLLILYRSWFTNEYWTTAASQIPAIEKSFLMSKRKVKVLKLPKYCLPDHSRHELLRLLGVKSNPNKLVLIAPTWRSSRFGNTQAGLDLLDLFNWLNEGRLSTLIEKGIHLVIRPHPITLEYLDTSLENVSFADVELIEIIEPYLSVFDLVISDYSGVLADSAYADVPALAYLEGIEKFKSSKGLYNGVQELLEGIGVYSFQELYDYLIFEKFVDQKALKQLSEFFFDDRLQSYEQQLFPRQ